MLFDTLLATRLLLSFVVGLPVNATLAGLALLLFFLILRLATRKDWIAAVLVVAFLVAGDLAEGDLQQSLWLILPLAARRLGVVHGPDAALRRARRDHRCLDRQHAARLPRCSTSGSWTGSSVFVVLPLMLTIAVLAFRSSLGGQVGLRRYLAGEAYGSRPA